MGDLERNWGPATPPSLREDSPASAFPPGSLGSAEAVKPPPRGGIALFPADFVAGYSEAARRTTMGW